MLIKKIKPLLIINLMVCNGIAHDFIPEQRPNDLNYSNLKKISVFVAVAACIAFFMWLWIKLISSLSKTREDQSNQSNPSNDESGETNLKEEAENKKIRQRIEDQIKEQVNKNDKIAKDAIKKILEAQKERQRLDQEYEDKNNKK